MILGLDEDARSRINTIYVTAIFSGGTLGSAMASFAWQWAGWMAVSLLGLTLAAIALLIHLGGRDEARA
jgi:dipeptide/tripeptide permease